jgi:hypothetical protein
MWVLQAYSPPWPDRIIKVSHVEIRYSSQSWLDRLINVGHVIVQP